MERRILRISETSSTNSLLKEMATRGAESGQVVIAARQSGGRGRQGRSFASPEGGLYLSYLYRPEAGSFSPGAVTAAAAVAVCRALESFGVFPGIKWVNDLMLGGKKICGILCEAVSFGEGMACVIGLGLNVKSQLPEQLRDIAASVLEASGIRLDMEALAQAVVRELDAVLGGDCLEEYRARCVTVGRQVLVVQGQRSFSAFAEAVEEDFSLLVRREDGMRESVSFGEVSVRV